MWSGKEKQWARFRDIIEVLFCSIRYVLVHPQNICHLRIRIFAEQIKWTIISCRPIKFLFLIQYVLFVCLCFVFLFSFVCFFFQSKDFYLRSQVIYSFTHISILEHRGDAVSFLYRVSIQFAKKQLRHAALKIFPFLEYEVSHPAAFCIKQI